jgi:hypothetical protein
MLQKLRKATSTRLNALVEKVLKENPAYPEGVFLDVIGRKSLYFFVHAIHSHLYQLILLPTLKTIPFPMVSEIYTKQSIDEENSNLFMNSIL